MDDDSDVIDAEYECEHEHTVTLRSWRAQPTGELAAVNLVVSFDRKVPDVYGSVANEPGHLVQMRAYQEEADRIVAALAEHLPGGLFDAIFASMCSHKASVLRVAEKAGG